MRISDWSSDVCSSDLTRHERDERAPSLRPFAPSAGAQAPVYRGARAEPDRCIFMRTDSTSTSACRRRVLRVPVPLSCPPSMLLRRCRLPPARADRTNAVYGKNVSVRLYPGFLRVNTKKHKHIKL